MRVLTGSTEPVQSTYRSEPAPAAGSGEVVAPSTRTGVPPAPLSRRRQIWVVDELAREDHWLADWSTRFGRRRELTGEEAYLAEDPPDSDSKPSRRQEGKHE
jgi:hypothetical protein